MIKIKSYINTTSAFYIAAAALCLFFALVCYFSIAGFGRPSSSFRGKSLTYDEVSHIPAGYYYLTTGKYFLNPEHPPLVKTLAALPLLTLKITSPKIDKKLEVREDGQWSWGSKLLFDVKNDTNLITTLARSSVIFFNTLFMFILTFSLAKLVNKRMALLALSLVAFSPLSLAHASLVTMDFMSSILQMTTIVTFCLVIKELKRKGRLNWYYFAGFAAALSGALLAKFSSLFLVPALFIGGFLYILLPKNKRPLKHSLNLLVVFMAALCVSLLVMGATYALQMRSMQSKEVAAQFADNWPGHLSATSARVLNKMIHLGPLVRGWAEYINGTLIISSVVEKSKSSVYFFGHNYGHGGAGILYFPVLYIVKMPLGFHLLTIFVLSICLKAVRANKFKAFISQVIKRLLTGNPLPLLLICFMGLYSAMALRSTLQIGMRHILPSILALTILLAYLINQLWTRKVYKNVTLGKASLYLIASLFITVLLAFPDYLAYYNILAGGTNNGYKTAADSNYDWGQDLKALKKWRQQNNINFAYVDIFTNPFGELEYYLGPVPKKEDYRGSLVPTNSFIAISANRYVTNLASNDLPDTQKYLALKPYFYKRIGKSILIFKTP